MNMKLIHTLATAAVIASLTAACTSDNDNIPMMNVGLDDAYFVARMQKLRLCPDLTGDSYQWTVTAPDGTSTVAADTRDYIFLEAREGVYAVTLAISDNGELLTTSTTVHVIHEDVEYSPYISRVYEYCPAPGQFVNQLPLYDEGDTYADMLAKAERCIAGTADEPISLGAWGGYVTFGFDHTIVSRPEGGELRLWGNAFYNESMPGVTGGSAEPGIVSVSFDANCNGIPDDPWYELAGSEYPLNTTTGYSVAYTWGDTTDSDIEWTSLTGESGTIPHLRFHPNSYFPQWITEKSLTFTGSKLPGNGMRVEGSSDYFLKAYAWGYADNHPNTEAELNTFSIGHAVDSRGVPVALPGVDFVRVHTAVQQVCGPIGETSTEVSRAADLTLSK